MAEETKLEKLARVSGKATSKGFDALARHGFDLRGKLSAPISRVPRGLLRRSQNRTPNGFWRVRRGTVNSYQLVAHPRLLVEKLADLRALFGALVASRAGDLPRCKGAGHAQSATQSEGSVRRSGTADGASARATDQVDAVAPGSTGGGGRRRIVPEQIGRLGRRGGP